MPTAVRVLARFARCRSPEDAHELAAAIAKQSRPQTNAVAGYDLTFSPVKSVSTLWALAELTVCPPSTTVACPVTKVAASEQSHSTGGGGDVDVVMGDYLAEATMAGVSSMKVFLPMMRPRSTRPYRSLSAV